MKAFFIHMTPGEPDLLSVKAVNAIINADLIVMDETMTRATGEFFPKECPVFNELAAALKYTEAQHEKSSLTMARLCLADASDIQSILGEVNLLSE
ncbi:MAG TPA: hypothetical protein VD772_03200, partial [Anseongella sp.]|nr:hypothetical protein [Anseongella sp.]